MIIGAAIFVRNTRHWVGRRGGGRWRGRKRAGRRGAENDFRIRFYPDCQIRKLRNYDDLCGIFVTCEMYVERRSTCWYNKTFVYCNSGYLRRRDHRTQKVRFPSPATKVHGLKVPVLNPAWGQNIALYFGCCRDSCLAFSSLPVHSTSFSPNFLQSYRKVTSGTTRVQTFTSVIWWLLFRPGMNIMFDWALTIR